MMYQNLSAKSSEILAFIPPAMECDHVMTGKNSYNLDMFMPDYITHQVGRSILQNYVSHG